jgi:hypothetical protein
MPKYVALWEMDASRIPADPQQFATLMAKMIDMTKQWLKDHPGAEWGAFIGEGKGYCSADMSAQDVIKVNMMFTPYVHFKVYQAASIKELEEVYKPSRK